MNCVNVLLPDVRAAKSGCFTAHLWPDPKQQHWPQHPATWKRSSRCVYVCVYVINDHIVECFVLQISYFWCFSHPGLVEMSKGIHAVFKGMPLFWGRGYLGRALDIMEKVSADTGDMKLNKDTVRTQMFEGELPLCHSDTGLFISTVSSPLSSISSSTFATFCLHSSSSSPFSFNFSSHTSFIL